LIKTFPVETSVRLHWT